MKYRLINLIGCIIKIISKTLACRLKKVIGSVVSIEQSSYVSERNIMNRPLLVNEIISWAKRKKEKVLLFKVDFDKAFDSLSWNYSEDVMRQMGFGNIW